METVSVIIPVHNHEQFIGETIESVMNQSCPHTQIIVVDDGSTDGTRNVLETYGDRIEVIRQMNAGVVAARNTGINKAIGDYVCILDCDDLFLPNKVELQLAVFRNRPDVGLVHTGAMVERKTDTGWETWYTYIPVNFFTREACIGALLRSNMIVCSTVMVKRELFSQVGLFDDTYRYNGEDYDMWLRLLTRCNFESVPQALLKYRWHGGNMSQYTDPSLIRRVQIEGAKRFGRDIPKRSL
jgi:glycosyltransferase involved in cell wall biosynthesis